MVTEIFDVANYAYNVHAVPFFLTAVAILLLGLAVLIRERFTRVSISFFLMALTTGVWCLGFSLALSATAEGVALLWTRVGYLGITLTPSAIYHFSVTVLDIYQKHRRTVTISWMLSGIFLIAAFGTDALINGVYHYWWGYYVRYGWMGVPFLVFLSVMYAMSMGHYWAQYRRAMPETAQKYRAKEFLLAFGIGFLTMAVTPAKFGIPVYPLIIPLFFFVLLAARVIWRYHLVDITPAFAANQILDTMNDSLLVLDQESRIRVANPAACELFGCAEKGLIGKPIGMILEDPLFSDVDKLMEAGTLRDHEITYQSQILSLSASVIRDRAEQPVAVVCLLSDITERKRAEEELREKTKEVEEQREELATMNEELQASHDELRTLNQELESMVEERTKELLETNKQLRREIAERKRLEKENLEAKDRIIDEMKRHEEYVLDVADRLRNPLQVLMSHLEIFEKDTLTPEQMDTMGKIEKSSRDLEEGIKKLT
jgi:PAS domain S-box-containing protein